MARRRSAIVLAAMGGGLAAAVAVSRFGRARLGAARQSMARSSMPSARSYELASRIFFRPVFEHIARTVAATAPAEAAVLDIGCGPGHLAIRLAHQRAGLRVIGADLDPAMIERATANGERAFPPDDPAKPVFVVADVAALPFPDRSFDLVVSTFSLHHWSDPAAGFAELYRVLRPGGRAQLWDIAGPIRRLETAAVPVELASRSPFGVADIGGRWGVGPLVLAKRYDLVRSAIEEPVADTGSAGTPAPRRAPRRRARPTTAPPPGLVPGATDDTATG